MERAAAGSVGAWASAGKCRLVALLLGLVLVLPGCNNRTDTAQQGFRGSGMVQVQDPGVVAKAFGLHAVPEPEPVDPPEPDGPTIDQAFKNVQVLRDLSVLEFSRLMQALSTWVAPEEGCDFCHNPKNLASDEKYTKVVARQMLRMTRDINTKWKSHVAGTGVTCWTCHRGQAVPSGDWFANLEGRDAKGLTGPRDRQNQRGIVANGNSALPSDALAVFLQGDDNLRVQNTSALADGNGRSVKTAEWTYSLMIYMSKSLGVNCTFCHNTRALARWEQSPLTRTTAWYGIRMVRELNNSHLSQVAPLLPSHRMSAEGDWPKVGCETCHKGVNKPLYGVSMLADYPELAGVMVRSDKPAGPTAAAPAATLK